ncbi:penicillin acylase family protein [Acidobacteriota bacterium]
MKNTLKFAAVSLLFFILGVLFFFFAGFRSSLPKIKGSSSFKGLIAEVQIITDNWGVPHIYAQNESDLFFACGYSHARDRMWQMELIRKMGLGRLSEILGKAALDRDKINRNLGLKEAAQKDFEKLSARMKSLLISYSKGVNSWMNSGKFRLPPEFLLLRYRPEPWNLMDTVIIKEIMASLLCMDFPSEIIRAKLIKKFGAERVLKILEDGIINPPFIREDLSLSELYTNLLFQGSNSWALAGNRTESGKPLLANDPHLGISLPPVWYEIHLSCPTLNVIGASIPGIPSVIIGHNESIAWGITNSAADVQDLYIEKLNSAQDMYFDDGDWKPLVKKKETIKIKGEKHPERMDIIWTERGPLISPLIVETNHPISLSWTIFEGGRTLDSFYLLNKARNWSDFVDALKLFDAPSHNFVYADTSGNIGYYLSGKIPLRTKKTALFPVPGWEAENNWMGFLEEEEKPDFFNLEEGFIVAANHKIISDSFPYYVSCDWDTPFRAERIRELVLSRGKHDIASMERIQNDIFSKKGELFLSFLKEIKKEEENLNAALDIILDWDLKMSSGKRPALFGVFMDFFHEDVFADELGEDFKIFDLLFRRKHAGLVKIISDPQSPWFDKKDTPVVETRSDIIKISLERSYEWLRKNFGGSENWDWMEMNSIHYQHALGQVLFLRFLNRGSFPLKGRYFTVNAAYSLGNRTTYGASFRQIIDLSNWEHSVCVVTSGQSGHFLSRFYDDQIPLWLYGQYHPMLFKLESIKAESRGILLMSPSSRD